jgi:hypothetical protein
MKQFKNLNRAAERGHVVVHFGTLGLELFRRVKSDKQGKGHHSRWFKGVSSLDKPKLTRY